MMKMFSFRAREYVMKEIDRLAKLEKIDKSLLLREALEKGLAQVKLEIAMRLFAEGKLSIGEAAEIGGISVGEMMEKLVKRGIHVEMNLEDIKEGLETALKAIK